MPSASVTSGPPCDSMYASMRDRSLTPLAPASGAICSVLTLAGCVPWVFMLTFIGKEAGDRWESWKDYLHYVDYAVAALIAVGIVYLLLRRRGGGDSPATESA